MEKQTVKPDVMKSMKVTAKYNLIEIECFVNVSDDGTLIIVPEEPTECIRKIEVPFIGTLFEK